MSRPEEEERALESEALFSARTQAGVAASLEARLEELADEMDEVIASCPPEERESLNDYAVSLIRERRYVAGVVAASTRQGLGEDGLPADPGGGRLSIGYGFLVLLVAPLLLLVFPPVGVLLGLAGGAMIVAGLISALVSRIATPHGGTGGEDGV